VKLTPPQAGRDNKLVGGLAEPEAFPDYARYNYEGQPKDIAPASFSNTPKHISGTYIYGGFLMAHFGHVLTECVHRLWASSLAGNRDLPVLFMASAEIRDIEEILEPILKHFKTGEIILVREDSIVETLIIGQSGKQFRRPCLPGYIDWLSDHIQLDDYVDPDLPDKLCVMRGHLIKGTIIGESTIEGWLEDDGYHILHPEDHSLSKQLSYLCSAREIVFSEGSAMHLMDILPPIKARVAIIRRRPITTIAQTTFEGKVKDFYVYDRVSRALHHDVNDGLKFNKALSYVNLPDVAKFLTKNGFLQNDPDTSFYNEAVYSNGLGSYFNDIIAQGISGVKKGSEDTSNELAIERLLEEHLGQYGQMVEIRYKLFLTYMHWAMELGAYIDLERYAIHTLRFYPECAETKTFLKIAREKQRACKSRVGRLVDRIKRASSILFGSKKPYDISPPDSFYNRKT
jgi:hypothetical protein